MELLENNDFANGHSDIEIVVKKQSSSSSDKIDRIEHHFAQIMKELDLDLTDDSLKDTPRRVAKMYVNEIFAGLDRSNEPRISNFNNSYGYHGVLICLLYTSPSPRDA